MSDHLGNLGRHTARRFHPCLAGSPPSALAGWAEGCSSGKKIAQPELQSTVQAFRHSCLPPGTLATANNSLHAAQISSMQARLLALVGARGVQREAPTSVCCYILLLQAMCLGGSKQQATWMHHQQNPAALRIFDSSTSPSRSEDRSQNPSAHSTTPRSPIADCRVVITTDSSYQPNLYRLIFYAIIFPPQPAPA